MESEDIREEVPGEVADVPVESPTETSTESNDIPTVASTTVGENPDVPVKFNMYPLPNLNVNRLSKEFILTEYNNVEITSLDMTPHGCFVLAGCSNGMVILFDMTSANQHGYIVGHIRAKGLHTNLLLSVKVTEDSRFCFAGVQKGSSELLAIDMGSMPMNWGSSSGKKGGVTSLPIDRTIIYSHSDPKLRGFCAAVRMIDADLKMSGETSETATGLNPSGHPSKYRLACGRGIKNVHVWQFEPDTFVEKGGHWVREPRWTCIYDVASNGNTIESIAFRDHGLQVISKSAGVPLRVWDLSQHDVDPNSKPSYEDIANSHDIKCVFDGYAFGGTFEFAVVKINAPKAANRDSFEMPERNTDDENGQRRRRMHRQVDDVIGTHDALHVLVLCTDGGVMYFNRFEQNMSAEIVEFGLQREVDVDQAWAMKRVGHSGDVLLLRAAKSSCKKYNVIHVGLLSQYLPMDMKNRVTTYQTAEPDMGYYFEVPISQTFPQLNMNESSNIDDVVSMAVPVLDAPVKSKPPKKPSTPATKKAHSPREPKTPSFHGDGGDMYVTPSQGPLEASGNRASPGEDTFDRLTSHHHGGSPMVKTSSSSSNSQMKRMRETSETTISRKERKEKTNVNFMEPQEYSYVEQPMMMMEDLGVSAGPALKIIRIVESDKREPAIDLSNLSKAIWNIFNVLKQQYLLSQQPSPSTLDAVVKPKLQQEGHFHGNVRTLEPWNVRSKIGTNVMQHLHMIQREQHLLRSQYVNEVDKIVTSQVASLVDKLETQSGNYNALWMSYFPSYDLTLENLEANYKKSVRELVNRQQMEVSAAQILDNMMTLDESTKNTPIIVYQFMDMFTSSKSFADKIYQFIHSQSVQSVEYKQTVDVVPMMETVSS